MSSLQNLLQNVLQIGLNLLKPSKIIQKLTLSQLFNLGVSECQYYEKPLYSHIVFDVLISTFRAGRDIRLVSSSVT